MSNPSMIMVEAGGVDNGPAVEAAAKPPEVAPAGSEEELSASQGLLLTEPGSTLRGLPSRWVISTPANPGLSSSMIAVSAGGECWNCSNGSRRGNGGGVSVTWSSSSPVLVVLLVTSSGGGEEVLKR